MAFEVRSLSLPLHRARYVSSPFTLFHMVVLVVILCHPRYGAHQICTKCSRSLLDSVVHVCGLRSTQRCARSPCDDMDAMNP